MKLFIKTLFKASGDCLCCRFDGRAAIGPGNHGSEAVRLWSISNAASALYYQVEAEFARTVSNFLPDFIGILSATGVLNFVREGEEGGPEGDTQGSLPQTSGGLGVDCKVQILLPVE